MTIKIRSAIANLEYNALIINILPLMQKILLSFMACVLGTFAAKAVMAYPYPVTVEQPDGTELTLQMHGDEFCNFTTTADGYTVVKSDRSGAWEYASLTGDRLTATGIISRDAAARTAAETNMLLTTPRMLCPYSTAMLTEAGTAARVMQQTPDDAITAKKGAYDYTKFRGLVILVEYEDCKFSRSDAYDIFNSMLNSDNFTGFLSTTSPVTKIKYTGSVRKYYNDNSMGLFNPHFDLAGPVTIPYSKDYVKQVANAQTVVKAALEAADNDVDYSRYDTDGDGTVDMVYFIFAGAGSNYTGNNQNLIWPHASIVVNFSLDEVKFDRYACSTELYGREASKNIDGIGTICHEFSHVLGLPDVYDTDYATNGQSRHPANWSVMASGSYLNSSKTPCAYSLYERYAIGFTVPETITEPGNYEIDYIGTTGTGYRIDSPVRNEYFLLENRQKILWDAYLPGEGMLVFRVDSTDVSVWENNTVNTVAARNYYELIRANPNILGTGAVRDSDGDPFPGSGNITGLTLTAFSGKHASLTLADISTDSSGKTIIKVENDETSAGIEDVTDMEHNTSPLKVTSTGNRLHVTGAAAMARITVHDLSGRTVTAGTADTEGNCTLTVGTRGIYMINDGTHSAKKAI